MMQIRKRIRATPSEYQSPDVTLPVFDIIASLKVIIIPFSIHGLSISPLGRFVNPCGKILSMAYTGLFLFVNIGKEYTKYVYFQKTYN